MGSIFDLPISLGATALIGRRDDARAAAAARRKFNNINGVVRRTILRYANFTTGIAKERERYRGIAIFGKEILFIFDLRREIFPTRSRRSPVRDETLKKNFV